MIAIVWTRPSFPLARRGVMLYEFRIEVGLKQRRGRSARDQRMHYHARCGGRRANEGRAEGRRAER
jgi:hypothetical protein